MDEKQIETTGAAMGAIFGNLLVIGCVFVLAIIFDISPTKEYGWFAGGFHGVWAPAYWIMSWFSDNVLVKAPIHTTAYNIFWWVGVITGVWSWFKMLLSIILNARKI